MDTMQPFSVEDTHTNSLLLENLLKNQRYLLMNADAQGMMRRDLIKMLGRERAKGFLLRFGWSCGYNDAKNILKNFPNESDAFLQKQGPVLHSLEGIVNSEFTEMEIQLDENKFYLEGLWNNSYEAEQHLKHFGPAQDTVCWTLKGYASGYSSGLFNRRIYSKEIACVGHGDETCKFISKPIEDWGDEIASDLPYYEESIISEELEEMHRKLQSQYQLLEYIMRVHEQLNRMVLDGHNREEIIQTVGQMLEASIVIEDKELNPLAWWLHPSLHTDLTDCSLKNVLTKDPSLQSWLASVQREKKAMDLQLTEPGIHPRTTVPIMVGAEVMGYLSVLYEGKANEDIRHMITERAATVIGIDFLKEQIQLETEHRLRGAFLDELLDDSTPIDSLMNRAKYMGHNLHDSHRLLLVGIDPPWIHIEDQEQFLQIRKDIYNNVQSAMKYLKQNVMVVERPKGVLVLINTSKKDVNPLEIARAIMNSQQKLSKVTVSVSVSKEARSVEELRTGFTSCKSDLEVMVRLGRINEIFFPDQLSMFDLLFANSSSEELCTLAQQILHQLLQYDHTYDGQLTETLHVFLMNECNLQQSKKALNISLSGLKYRLQRIKELSGIDLDNPDERFNLQLALRILIANGTFSFTQT